MFLFRRLKFFTFLIALALVFWAAGFLWFVADVPERVLDNETPTDAIVVLTGGSERLGEGFSLMRRNMGKKLLISGVHKDVTLPELLKSIGENGDISKDAVVLGYVAGNTVGNAQETAAWMQNQGFASLRLVTGNYHMRRSLQEFSWAMPKILIIPHPVFPAAVISGEWWKRPGTAQLIFAEYNKFLAMQVIHFLDGAKV